MGLLVVIFALFMFWVIEYGSDILGVLQSAENALNSGRSDIGVTKEFYVQFKPDEKVMPRLRDDLYIVTVLKTLVLFVGIFLFLISLGLFILTVCRPRRTDRPASDNANELELRDRLIQNPKGN